MLQIAPSTSYNIATEDTEVVCDLPNENAAVRSENSHSQVHVSIKADRQPHPKKRVLEAAIALFLRLLQSAQDRLDLGLQAPI